ncbi:hydrogenase maturation protease [Halorhabdus sp. BNX81]|uniref:hydrogenase maturation protease n=1 Tax=Halorhabdus sp. BNX81 TaxID=2980181 RepID=UPI0023DCEEDE|nr:hydrogenase maturation protease [Halorhabdus sp. BNX81]WEL21021.1 Hydrogenase maturation protease [Halorhabdus sp. BNX81]
MTADRAIVALGNPYRRDDGIGPALVDRLREEGLSSVDCLDLGDAGFELVHVVADYDAVVIVDAVDFGGDPGEIVVFDPADPETATGRRGTHGTDPFELLEVASRVADTNPSIRVVGIQPAETGYGDGLSQPVSDSLPAGCRTLRATVRSL